MNLAKPTDLQTRRGRFFFWVGLVILPVFWVWWMRPPYFSHVERRAGWCWTWIYLKLLLYFHEPVGSGVQAALQGWQVVFFWITLVLWLWLALRLFRLDQIFFGYIVLGEVVTPVIHLYLPAFKWLAALLASPAALILMPVLPAVLHLLVVPVREWRQGRRMMTEAA
ncbi:hypothetical protein [Prosthecobacter sp.]|uniref:hypothetical protein n=1 Tax=Prosthecobacter sp. TaxID=1965333 RepID=UPI003783143C